MKNLKTVVFGSIILGIIIYFGRPTRNYILSPDHKNIITLYCPPFLFFEGDIIYLTPYKYLGFLPPSTNYVIIQPKGGGVTGPDNFFNINWQPTTKYTLKIAFEFKCTLNKLDTTKYFFAEKDIDDYLDAGEESYYPKYGSYSLDDILSGQLPPTPLALGKTGNRALRPAW